MEASRNEKCGFFEEKVSCVEQRRESNGHLPVSFFGIKTGRNTMKKWFSKAVALLMSVTMLTSLCVPVMAASSYQDE